MIRFAIPAVLLVVTACAPTPPDDVVRGVGFGSIEEAEAQRLERDRSLEGPEAALPDGPVISAEEMEGNSAPEITVNNPGISDTNNFNALAERESIEDNAARLAAQREVFEVIPPTDLPERGRSRPNIVQYALGTKHPVGEVIWGRSGFNSEARFNRNCAKYPSSDLAQEDFLARGGPRNDRLGLDPDGDGYACYWDPTPYRTVQSAGN